ncbi:MAG: AI-2E family transporter [Candidatus Pacearchaeota archaeon]|nr:AI-2E family transporter [Candidatus Pacearchaeota archaeon]
MSLNNKDIKRIFVITILLVLFVASILVLRPILLSILGGLILAYIFSPVYNKLHKIFKEKNTTAFAVATLLILLVILPLWFLVPIAIQQTFDFFTLTQSVDFSQIVETIFPTSSLQFQQDTTAMIIRFIGNITSSAINGLVGFILNLPSVLLQLAVIIFVFFFSLRDQQELKEFISGISPFKKEKEKLLTKRFKEITSSIIFGYIVVGIIQGITLGIGFLIFGVPRALTLTVFAIFSSILPMVGPWLVWIPVAIYLLASGDVTRAILFTIYAGALVSSIDNILRPYIVAKKTGTSSVIVLIGMIGGLFVFGIMGIILGPLILSYLVIFLRAYKDKTLSDMFSPE